MKYFVFIVFALVAIPAIIAAVRSKKRYFSPLFASTVFLTMYINSSRIHFVSYEDYRGPDRGFEVSLIDVIMIGLLPAVVGSKNRKGWPYNLTSHIVFAILCTLSIMNTPADARLYAAFTCYKMFKLAGIYWIAYNAWRMGLKLQHLAWAYGTMAILITITALKQKYLWGLYRIPGPFDHSNTVPMYCALILPPLYLWASCRPGLPRWQSVLGSAGCLGMMFCVLATQSRAGLLLVGGHLGLSVAISLVRGIHLPKTQRRRIKKLAAVIAILGLLGGLKALNTIITRFKTAPEQSEQAREEFNLAAKLMLQDRPWGGVGINNFSYVLTREARYNGHIVVMANEEQAGVAHHIYKLTAAELGYPGIICFVGLWFLAWWRPLRVGLRGREFESVFLLGFPLGFETLYVIGLLEWAYRLSPVIYLFTIQAGLAAGLAEQLESQRLLQQRMKRSKSPRTSAPTEPKSWELPNASSGNRDILAEVSDVNVAREVQS